MNKLKNVAKLVKRDKIGKNVIELSFKIDLPLDSVQNIQFKPGQYIAVIIDSNIRRQYSISSFNKDEFQIIYDIKPNGIGVQYLENLKLQDEIEFIGPIGNFSLQETKSENIYFIATGTGLGPLKSMIDYLTQNEAKQESKLHLIFGTRYAYDILYESYFDNLLKNNLLDEYKIYLSGENDMIDKYNNGRVTEYFNNKANFANSDFYICGSLNMIKDVENLLNTIGVPKDSIFYEKYY